MVTNKSKCSLVCSKAATVTIAVTKEPHTMVVLPSSPLQAMSLSAKAFVESEKSSESYSASVSNSASSVMVEVELARGVFGNAGRESAEQSDEMALLDEEEEMFAWERNVMMMEMDGCDGVEFGDGWM